MQFTLSPEITDQIIFAMENQTEKMVFDTEKREVLTRRQAPSPVDTERYVDIPEWNSFSGFQLMEKFVAALRNPVYREALRSALAQGKGVFRKFKDVLKENREIERLWYAYKEKEMKGLVKEWYLALSELQGFRDLEFDLEFLEETGEIIVEDFVFDTVLDDIGFDALASYDKTGFFSALEGFDPVWVEKLYRRRLERLPEMSDLESKFYAARSPAGDFAGFLWAVTAGGKSITIVQVFILEEFRGLGLASALMDAFITEIAETGDYTHIELELPGKGQMLSDHFERQGFSVYARNIALPLKNWNPHGRVS